MQMHVSIIMFYYFCNAHMNAHNFQTYGAETPSDLLVLLLQLLLKYNLVTKRQDSSPKKPYNAYTYSYIHKHTHTPANILTSTLMTKV